MSDTGSIPIGYYDAPQGRAQAIFQQPRRFPEYLRLQNIRERVVDIVEFSGPGIDAPSRATDAVAGPACDRTLARIGDVLPVTPAESSTEAGSNSASPVPTNSHMIDGIGRMIDVIA